jgi:hypothetical protein
MAEAVFAGAVLAIALRLIARSMRSNDGFARYCSRGAYMRELNRQIEVKIQR